MDIKTKAIERIAAQLASLVGANNFRIIAGDVQYGEYTDVVEVVKPKKSFTKVFDFKNETDFYPRIEALTPGESLTLSAPGVPVGTLQSAAVGIASRYHGAGNCMTSRNKDGSVDVLRLT
jgi:hypothetical protein